MHNFFLVIVPNDSDTTFVANDAVDVTDDTTGNRRRVMITRDHDTFLNFMCDDASIVRFDIYCPQRGHLDIAMQLLSCHPRLLLQR